MPYRSDLQCWLQSGAPTSPQAPHRETPAERRIVAQDSVEGHSDQNEITGLPTDRWR